MVKIGKYNYELSTRKNKKLMVKIGDKMVHFGSKIPLMGHYFDKTELLPKSLNHKDEKRRASYRARHGGIKLKDGSLAIKNPNQPAYHALKILWT